MFIEKGIQLYNILQLCLVHHFLVYVVGPIQVYDTYFTNRIVASNHDEILPLRTLGIVLSRDQMDPVLLNHTRLTIPVFNQGQNQ